MLYFDFSHLPVFLTERLQLRAIRSSDVDALYALRSDPRVMRYVDRPLARTREEVEDLVQRMLTGYTENTGASWCITHADADTLIGNIGIWRIDAANHRGEIGYILHPDLHNKGYMTEAMRPVLQYAFEDLGLHTIEANINPLNIGSQRILEKHGFILEAYFRDNCYFNDVFSDSAIYTKFNPAHPVYSPQKL
ncbi:MAG: GNAT family N-acetyltransferase [Chitinophagales bacterium]